MANDTERRLAKVEVRVEAIEGTLKEWKSLLKKTIFKTIRWLIYAMTGAAIAGYHAPTNVRKIIAQVISDWAGK